MPRSPLVWMLLAAGLCLFGCGNDDRGPVPGPDAGSVVAPRIEIVADGTVGLSVDACVPNRAGISCFEVGGFTAEAAGASTTLVFVATPGEPADDDGHRAGRYTGRLTGDAPGTEVVVTWSDGSAQERWRVTVPDVFAITSPAVGAELVDGPGLQVTWSPSGSEDEMGYEISFLRRDDDDPGGSFESSYRVAGLDDTGSGPVAVSSRPLDAGDRCDVDIALDRTRTGRHDGAAPSVGVIHATQRRHVSFAVVGPRAP